MTNSYKINKNLINTFIIFIVQFFLKIAALLVLTSSILIVMCLHDNNLLRLKDNYSLLRKPRLELSPQNCISQINGVPSVALTPEPFDAILYDQQNNIFTLVSVVGADNWSTYITRNKLFYRIDADSNLNIEKLPINIDTFNTFKNIIAHILMINMMLLPAISYYYANTDDNYKTISIVLKVYYLSFGAMIAISLITVIVWCAILASKGSVSGAYYYAFLVLYFVSFVLTDYYFIARLIINSDIFKLVDRIFKVRDNKEEFSSYNTDDLHNIDLGLIDILDQINSNSSNYIVQLCKIGVIADIYKLTSKYKQSEMLDNNNIQIIYKLKLLYNIGAITFVSNKFSLTVYGKEIIECPRLLYITPIPVKVTMLLAQAEQSIKENNSPKAISICSTQILEGYTRSVIVALTTPDLLKALLKKHVKRTPNNFDNSTLGELYVILSDALSALCPSEISPQDKSKIMSIFSACKTLRNNYSHLKATDADIFTSPKCVEDSTYLLHLTRIYVSVLTSRAVKY